MIPNLKVLGMALLAALAMSAVAASAASADFMTAGGQDVTLTVEAEPGETAQIFSAPGFGELACNEVTTHDEIVSPGQSITVVPTYSGCTAVVGESEVKARVTFTSCHYTFTTEGNVHVDCTDPGDYIHIEVTSLNLNCFTIEDEQTLSGITYTNVGEAGERDITIDTQATGIKYTALGACGSGETESNATYVGKVTVTGDDPETGEHVDIWHEEGEW